PDRVVADGSPQRVVLAVREAAFPVAGHERRGTLQRIGEIAVADPHVRRSLHGGRRRLGHRPGHRALDLLHRTTARCASAELREEENRYDQRVSRRNPSPHLNAPPWRPLTPEAPVVETPSSLQSLPCNRYPADPISR